jgi:hypothetical protein
MNIQISGSPSRVKLDKLDKKTFASSKFDFLEALRCNPKISDLEYRSVHTEPATPIGSISVTPTCSVG